MEQAEQQMSGVGEWKIRDTVCEVTPHAVRYSKGYLRTQIKKWFPGFAAQWLPLSHSLGIEFKIGNISPVLTVPSGDIHGYLGEIMGEPVALFAQKGELDSFLEQIVPNSEVNAKDVVAEYFSRRLFKSLLLSWSGPELSEAVFVGKGVVGELDLFAGIEIELLVNNIQCRLWIALGKGIVDRLDGLWRRQLRSMSSTKKAPSQFRLEVAQIAVQPVQLSDYTRSGTLVDLETSVSDNIVLRSDDGTVVPAKLRRLQDSFCVETIAGAPPELTLPEGMTRLSVELGVASVREQEYAEHLQPGAIWETGIPLGTSVKLLVNKEVIAEASLGVYEGKFAISVR